MTNKPQNVKELIELIERYKSIELSEIEKCNFEDENVPMLLTGFGFPYSCKLCKAVNSRCKICVFGKKSGCAYDNKNMYILEIVNETYKAIEEATNALELKTAYNNRAVYLEKRFETVINNYKQENGINN